MDEDMETKSMGAPDPAWGSHSCKTDYQDLKFSLPNPTTQPTLITRHIQGYIQVLRLATIAYSKANVSPPIPPQSTTRNLQPQPHISASPSRAKYQT